MTPRLVAAVTAVVGLVGIGVGYYASGLLPGGSAPSSAKGGLPAEAKPAGRLAGLGKLQPTGGVLSVYGPAGVRVEEILVKSGKVKEKQPLVVLASKSDLGKEVAAAAEQVETARKSLKTLERSRDLRRAEAVRQEKALRDARKIELAAQKLEADVAHGQYEAAETARRRLADLDPSIVRVSPQEREQAELLVKQAAVKKAATDAAAEAAEQKYLGALEALKAQDSAIDVEFDLSRDKLLIPALEQALAVAKLKEERSTLLSPADGRVLRVITPRGETIGVEPILQIAAGEEMVAVAEVAASAAAELRRALEGGPVEAKISGPNLPRGTTFKGVVPDAAAVADIVARGQATFGGKGDDRRVVEVRVKIDPADAAAAGRFIGLEVNVELTLSRP